MRVLITGATGYFGRHILPQLVQLNDVEVLTINRDVQKAQSLFIYSNCKHCSVEQMELEIRLFGPEVVFHLATLSTSRADESIIEPIVDSNITFGIRLLDVLSRIDTLKLFVNTGSFAEYRFGPKEIKDAYLYTATKSAFRHFVDFYADSIGFKYLTVVDRKSVV